MTITRKRAIVGCTSCQEPTFVCATTLVFVDQFSTEKSFKISHCTAAFGKKQFQACKLYVFLPHSTPITCMSRRTNDPIFGISTVPLGSQLGDIELNSAEFLSFISPQKGIEVVF